MGGIGWNEATVVQPQTNGEPTVVHPQTCASPAWVMGAGHPGYQKAPGFSTVEKEAPAWHMDILYHVCEIKCFWISGGKTKSKSIKQTNKTKKKKFEQQNNNL